MIYFDNCKISDKDFSEILQALDKSTRLHEIHIVRMTIRPLTKNALLLLCKIRAQQEFSIFFHETRFIDIYHSSSGDQFWHPFLSSFLVPIRHLTLVKNELRDVHLDLVASRLNVLTYVDISYN